MTVKSAAQVLALLAYFAQRRRPATLAEVARELGWARSSAHKLLATLSEAGYLYEPMQRGAHYPTPLWEAQVGAIGAADPLPPELRQALQSLVTDTGETAVLAAASGQQVVYVLAIESPQAVRYAARTGQVVPLHVTATGRALLAQFSPAEREAALGRAEFRRHTPTTLMSAQAVQAEIQASIQRGWFEGQAEFTPDLGGVALPLALAGRRLAVLVAGPLFRVQPRYPELAARMRQRLAPWLSG